MTDEFDHIRPYSQVHIALMPGEPYLVLETPAEIKAKVGEVMKDDEGDRMGIELGADGEGDPSRQVTLTALDCWAMPDGTFEVELYELTTYAVISVARGVSQRWWEDYVRRHQRQQPPGGGLGVVMASGVAEALSLGRAIPMSVAELDEDPERTCCCGHPADRHARDEEFVGQCADPDCRCPRFHTH